MVNKRVLRTSRFGVDDAVKKILRCHVQLAIVRHWCEPYESPFPRGQFHRFMQIVFLLQGQIIAISKIIYIWQLYFSSFLDSVLPKSLEIPISM